MIGWVKWAIVSAGWTVLATAVVFFGLGHSPVAWHSGGYTLTLDLLQTTAVLIAVLAFVVVQTLGVVSRLTAIAVGVEQTAEHFIATTAEAKKLADELNADRPDVASEIARSAESLASFVDSDIRERFGRRAWSRIRWQANLITIGACAYLMAVTACEAGLSTGHDTPTVVKTDWLHALYFLAAWTAFSIFVTDACLQKVKSDEIALSFFKRELGVINQELDDVKEHLAEPKG